MFLDRVSWNYCKRALLCCSLAHGLLFLIFRAYVDNKVLKLVSRSHYLPHLDKEDRGGEDGHFMLTKEQAIGVFYGVGGWAEVGINVGDYARELMENTIVAIKGEPQNSIDPIKVLEKAYLSTKSQGSSTACILVLSNKVIENSQVSYIVCFDLLYYPTYLF